MADFEDQITAKNLITFVKNEEVNFATHYGNGNNRRLTVTLTGRFRVYDGDAAVLTTRVAQKAIDKYNSLEVKKNGKNR